MKRVTGTLTDEVGDRNSYQQRTVGGADRLSSDDGGHYLATIFRGPGERINLTPMDSNLNRGAWKALENRWAQALRRGEEVRVVIDVNYAPEGVRPVRFVVSYKIGDDKPRRRIFKNAPGGR